MLSEILEKHLREIRAAEARPAVQALTPAPVANSVDPNAPTLKQREYFSALVAGKLTDDQRNSYMTAGATYTKREMSQVIQLLIPLPWRYSPATQMPSVQPMTTAPVIRPQPLRKLDQGYYAVVDPADNVLKFYQVRKPTQGKWIGWTFLNQVSGDNRLPVKDRVERERIFTEIEKDQLGALKRFGQEIGQCGHCRKQLTDADSRQFGIGPVCRKVLGV